MLDNIAVDDGLLLCFNRWRPKPLSAGTRFFFVATPHNSPLKPPFREPPSQTPLQAPLQPFNLLPPPLPGRGLLKPPSRSPPFSSPPSPNYDGPCPLPLPLDFCFCCCCYHAATVTMPLVIFFFRIGLLTDISGARNCRSLIFLLFDSIWIRTWVLNTIEPEFHSDSTKINPM